MAAAVVRAAALLPAPDVIGAVAPDGAGVTGLPYVVPWLLVAGRAALLDALPEVGAAFPPLPGPDAPGPEAAAPDVAAPRAAAPGAVAPGVAPPETGVVEAGVAEVGVALAAADLIGPAALVGVEDTPEPGAGLAPTPPAGFVVDDESGAPGFGGCFGAPGLVDEAPEPALRVVVSRDGVPAPPTVALPTVALPTAADARAELLEF